MIKAEILRARIAGLHYLRGELISKLKHAEHSDKKALELDIATLRNGLYPKGYDRKEIELLVSKQKHFDSSPLGFTELMSFNTYFEKYPEKICGQQIISSSREFPVTVKGTREDVEAAINRTLNAKENIEMQLQAKALELEMSLLNI